MRGKRLKWAGSILSLPSSDSGMLCGSQGYKEAGGTARKESPRGTEELLVARLCPRRKVSVCIGAV